MKKTCMVYMLWCMLLGACQKNTSQETQGNLADSVSATSATRQPVSLEGSTITVQCGKVSFDDAGVPSADIHLLSSTYARPVFLTKDSNCMEIKDIERSQYKIPAQAAFAFHSYAAGLGYYYYGIVKGNQVKVYRKRVEEATQDFDPPESDFTVFKVLTYYPDSVQTELVDTSEEG